MNSLDFFNRWIIILAFMMPLLTGCSIDEALPLATSQYTQDEPNNATQQSIFPVKTRLPTQTEPPIPSLTPTSLLSPITPTFTTHTVTPSPTPALWPVVPGRIAFFNPNFGLDLIGTDGSDWRHVVNTASGSFAWSPDGQWIVYVKLHERDAQKNELYIIKADGSKMRRLTYGPHWKFSPSWSPDGDYIIYTDAGSDGILGDIVAIKVDGSSSRKLTNTSGAEDLPTWSSNGRMIAFLYRETRSSPTKLYVMDADGSNRKQVTEFPVGFGQLAWSPDNKQIAFSSNDDGCGEIYVINLDGSDLKRLTDLPGCASDPTWSPYGKHIAFNASEKVCCNIRDMGWQIYIMNANGSGITRITSNPEWIPLYPAWAPVPALLINHDYFITDAGANLNLRDSPSLSGAVLKKLQAGEMVTILEGPVEANNYFWWKMRIGVGGMEGWAVEVRGWYSKTELSG